MRFLAAIFSALAALLPVHHHPRRHHRQHVRWLGPVVASWYEDGGQTACGFHARYGFASLFLPCGARVRMRGPGGSVVATSEDRGPYVAGRTFDLNPQLKAALSCGDLCSVRWSVAR